MEERSVRNAALYLRISRDRVGAGLGVKRQEEDGRKLAEDLGWPVGRVYIDNDMSAFYRKKPRKDYPEMLEAVKAGSHDAIITWHNDRLHRDMVELEEFIDVCEPRNLPVATVKAGMFDLSTPAGRMIARQLAAVARYESEHKSDRIRRKHQQKLEAGEWSGGGRRPYGYEPGGITIREAEAEVIREGARRILAGESLRSLAADLTRRGIPAAGGGHWTSKSLKQTLISARISGQRDYHKGGNFSPAVWGPIISPADTTRLRAVLRVNPGRDPKAPKPRQVLTSLLWCERCNNPLVSHSQASGVPAYGCRPNVDGRPNCGLSIRRAPLEELIFEAALATFDTAAIGRAASDPGVDDEDGPDLAAIEDGKAKLDELGRLHAEGKVSTTAWLAAVAPVEGIIEAAEGRLASRTREVARVEFMGRPEQLREDWPTLSNDRKRAILATVIDRIVIKPVGRGGWRHTPMRDRVVIAWKVAA
jgi:DNA invertase Pin-like site-specific DNA recombinase